MSKLKARKKVFLLGISALVTVTVAGVVVSRIFGSKGASHANPGASHASPGASHASPGSTGEVVAHNDKGHGDSRHHAQVDDEDEGDDEEEMQAESHPKKHAPNKPEKNPHKGDSHDQNHEKTSAPVKAGFFSSILETYIHAFTSVQDKVDILRKAQEQNERLQLENANLRVQTEGLRFSCRTKDAEDQVEKIQSKLSEETGTRVGRTLAGIQYRPPAHLLPEQIYTLAVGYFKAHEDEKAVVLFSFLTNLDEDNSYRTPQNWLMTGVTWYRLDNMKLADDYFGKALGTPAEVENLPYHAQARLWRALVAKRTSDKGEAQKWLVDLIDHHPHSTEAAWVNGPASKPHSKSKPLQQPLQQDEERTPAGSGHSSSDSHEPHESHESH